MDIALPSRLLRGRTVRVERLNCVEVNLDLDFGVSVKKRIIVEGVMPREVPRKLHSAAEHCMIVLLGGKRLLVHVADDADKRDGIIVGRVYLAEKTYGDPPGMRTPHGLDVLLLEVGEFFKHLATHKFDGDLVKCVLNKRAWQNSLEPQTS